MADVLRTPDDRFENLPGYAFEPHYVDVDGLRVHVVDEGPRDAAPILLLHGEPTWVYLYRKMIPILAAAGHRVVALDFVGFGRSDKLARIEDYSYQRHLDWTRTVIDKLELRDVTLFGQDWGGLIGLRLVAEDEDRFARVVAANTFLPTGDAKPPEIWWKFREAITTMPEIRVGSFVASGCATRIPDEIKSAYNAPFPSEDYKVACRAFPLLVPVSPDDPQSEPNRAAWKVLERWEKPFLTLFGDKDFIMKGSDAYFQRVVPGCAGQPHAVLEAGHFIQEDAGPELARRVVEWLR